MKIFRDLTDHEKVKQVVDRKGITVSKAEGKAGLGVGTLAKLKQRKGGDGSLHEDNLKKFLRTFQVSEVWWETGEGEMFEPSQTEQHPPTLMQILLESVRGVNKLVDANNGLVDKLDKDKTWAFVELEKLHAKLGISKDSQ